MMCTVIEKKPVAVGIPEIGPPESDGHFITCNFCLRQRRSWPFFRVVLRRSDGSGVSGSVNSIPDSETLICNQTPPCYLTFIDSQFFKLALVWNGKCARRKEPFLKRFFLPASDFCVIDYFSGARITNAGRPGISQRSSRVCTCGSLSCSA